MDKPVRLEWLLDEIIGPLLDRGDRGFDRAVSADHHHGQIRVLALQVLQNLDAVELAALQPDVEDHKMRPPLPKRHERGIAVRGDTGIVTLVAQNPRNQIADVLLVVHDEDFRRHQRPVLAHYSYPLFPSLIHACLFAATAAPTGPPRRRDRRRGRRSISLRHGPRKSCERWRGRAPSPSPAWSHRV